MMIRNVFLQRIFLPIESRFQPDSHGLVLPVYRYPVRSRRNDPVETNGRQLLFFGRNVDAVVLRCQLFHVDNGTKE